MFKISVAPLSFYHRLISNWTFLYFSDTICDLGGVDELANYGEYSGAPSEQQTYDYAKTILSLMTREKHSQGKDRLNITSACHAGLELNCFTEITRFG